MRISSYAKRPGMLDELTPAWLVVATKGTGSVAPDYPAVVVAEPDAASRWSTVAVVAPDASQSIAWASSRADAETSEGTVSRGLVPPDWSLRTPFQRMRHASLHHR